ncbi:MAG: molybdenum cofactor guanylyltransferase [Deltaproteobacteria bacterium]|nr:molybdenum cofactor guanylyltransferase [Deltaproteobacteria bacterium]
MTGIILSGGKNARMGENKSFIKRDGERIIDRTIRILSDIFQEIVLVTNAPLEYLDLDVAIVTDIIKGKAALGGIYTGLFHSSFDHSFVCPCDMPFLNADFIRYMKERIKGYDIVVPVQPQGFQPLHAIYSRKCMPLMKKLIDDDRLKITGLYRNSRLLKIPADVIATFDPEEKMFFNVNSPDDLGKMHAVSGRQTA